MCIAWKAVHIVINMRTFVLDSFLVTLSSLSWSLGTFFQVIGEALRLSFGTQIFGPVNGTIPLCSLVRVKIATPDPKHLIP